MATIDEGNGRYKSNIKDVCNRIKEYKEKHPDHIIEMLTNPYNSLVIKIYDITLNKGADGLIMIIEYLTPKTIDQVLALSDEHRDGRFW